MKRLEGKWALVTGSSRGIGRQIALGLAREGCNVIVHGREKEHTLKTLQEVKANGVQADSVEGELSSAEGIRKIIDAVRDKIGGVDILYNNAAISNPWKTIWEFTMEEWQHVLQVNLYGIIQLCNAFAPEMKARGYGRIINLTSGVKDQPNLAPYSVSKAAVDKYTRDLAAELKGTGVLVNYLDPGWLKTDLGGPDAWFEVESVVPGALVPALLDNDGPTGQFFYAQDYK